MAYIRTTWENEPSESTPINANNLNKIEEGIYSNSLKADQVGDLTDLKTTNKTKIVNAINELKDGETYSTTQEIDTGKTLDGKKIYRSYISFTHSEVGTYTYNHNLGIETITSINGSCTIAGQTIASHGFRQLPMVNSSTGNMFTIDTIRENTITTSAVGWSNNHIYLWLEYTKTTD